MTALLDSTRPTLAAEPAWVVELHGVDPVSGYRATWHITPVSAADCRIEHVAGDITHPAVWMQATKDTTIVSLDDAFELMRRIAQPR